MWRPWALSWVRLSVNMSWVSLLGSPQWALLWGPVGSVVGVAVGVAAVGAAVVGRGPVVGAADERGALRQEFPLPDTRLVANV